MVRKFYTSNSKYKSNTQNDEQRDIEEVLHLIGREVIPTCADIGKVANLAESASYFHYRDPKFWDTLEDRVVALLNTDGNQKMNLRQVS